MTQERSRRATGRAQHQQRRASTKGIRSIRQSNAVTSTCNCRMPLLGRLRAERVEHVEHAHNERASDKPDLQEQPAMAIVSGKIDGAPQ